jgi:hypothetical protein
MGIYNFHASIIDDNAVVHKCSTLLLFRQLYYNCVILLINLQYYGTLRIDKRTAPPLESAETTPQAIMVI